MWDQTFDPGIIVTQLKDKEDVPFWTRFIDEVRPRTYLKGDWLVRDSDPADRLFFLVRGTCCEVHQNSGYVFHHHRYTHRTQD